MELTSKNPLATASEGEVVEVFHSGARMTVEVMLRNGDTIISRDVNNGRLSAWITDGERVENTGWAFGKTTSAAGAMEEVIATRNGVAGLNQGYANAQKFAS